MRRDATLVLFTVSIFASACSDDSVGTAAPAETLGGAGGLSGANGGTTGGSAGLGGTVGSGGSGGLSGNTGGSAGSSSGGVGGSIGDGGVQGNGGAQGSGGSTGGANAAGGSTGTGGSSTGGMNATGGAATGGASGTCTEPDKTVCNNEIGQHCGYTYEYWKDQGSGCLVNTADGFSVDWNNINNLLGRKGVRPGSASQIVTYQANYQPNGNSYLCVYGWTKTPLVEYYIVESWGSWRPPGATSIATVNADGGTYDIYRTQRVNQPSIEGTRTFDQYWSVRTQKRTSGTVTVADHVSAWAGHGMNMGSFYEVSMTVEGYQSSGTAQVTFSMR